MAITILSVLLGICIWQCSISKKEIAGNVLHLLICAYLPLIANVIYYFRTDSLSNFIATEIDAVGTALIIMFFYTFTNKFCFGSSSHSFYDKFICIVLGLDVVNSIVNIFTQHTFYIDNALNTVEYTKIYDIHLIALYFGVLSVIILFIHKLFVVPKPYLARYTLILLAYIGTIIWETYYVFTDGVVDMSVFGYGICAIMVHMSAVEYRPKNLIDRMKNIVVSSTVDGVVFFDFNGVVVYANSAAKLHLNVVNDDIEELRKALEDKIKDNHESLKDVTSKKYDINFERDGQKVYWTVDYHKVFDGSGKLIGGFIKIHDRTDEQLKLDQERYVAMYDLLTGIYNKEYFYQQVRKTLDSNSDVDYLAIASDIKEFKLVNDRYGRDAGDEILKKIAEEISKLPGEDNVYGRLGVDRFAILVRKDSFDENVFRNVIDSIPALQIDTVYPIIVHSGIYEIESKDLRESVIFDRAFLAIKEIKNDLTKRIAYYDDTLRENLLWEQRIAGELDNAIKTKQIVPYLQAQVNNNGVVEGAEALVRWIHPEMGFLNPGRFIDVLEKNGTIAKLDMYMWESACKILRDWTNRGENKLYLSVNISPKDFYLVDVANEIISLVEKYDVDPSRLRLEITESIIMNDIDQKILTINKLRDYGFIVEMDDFGSGYSSLNLLKDLPVDILKLDMLFVKDKNHMEKTKRIMKLIIDLAKDLSIPVIAEGVEEEEQVRYLTEMGCDFFQGYYFARPESLDDYEKKNLA